MYMYLNYHHGSKLFPPQPMLQRKKGLLIFFNRKRLGELLKFLLVVSDFSFLVLIIVVQSPCHVRLFAAPWTVACQASLSLTTS